jgi:hypothetical protein
MVIEWVGSSAEPSNGKISDMQTTIEDDFQSLENLLRVDELSYPS